MDPTPSNSNRNSNSNGGNWQALIMSQLQNLQQRNTHLPCSPSEDPTSSSSPRLSQTQSQAQPQAQPQPQTLGQYQPAGSGPGTGSVVGGPLESIPESASESDNEQQEQQDDLALSFSLAQAVESTSLSSESSSLINTPTTSNTSTSSAGTATPNPPRSRLRSIDVPAISLPSSADVLTSLPDPRPLHVAAMRSSPGTQAHDLLATMESVLDPGTPRNVFNDLLRADRASIPDSMWVPKIALMFADAPWLVEAFLMVVGWIGPDPLMMSHVAPSSPPMPVPLGSIDASVPTAVFHARMPSPNYHAALMGSGPRAVSPPGTAKGWFIDHPRSPMHALSHPTSSASPSSSVSDQEQLQQTSQTPPLPVFHVSPAAAGGRLTDDGFANFHIPTILHSPVASPRESPSQSPDLSVTAPSPLGLGVHVGSGEIDPDSVPLAPSLLQVKPIVDRSRSPLAQSWTEAEAGDITDTEQPRGPGETLDGGSQQPDVDPVDPSASTTPNAQGQQEQQEVDDQDDDPLGWIDETSSSSSSSAAAPQPVSSTTAATCALTPSKLIETYAQLDKSRAHLLHLPPCGKLPSGNPAMLPLPQRVHQQQQMHHAAAHHHIHHAHSHGAHTSHAHGHGHGHAHVHVHGHGHRDHHGGFLHPSIAFGIHHGARHAVAPHSQETPMSLHVFHGHPDHVQMPGPQREDVHPRSSPRLISEAEVNAAVSDDKDDQQEHIRAARDRGHDSYALQKALSERRLGMDI